MLNRAAFIAAIRAAPNDDAPRLVFADWLQEIGEEHLAQFIRHSIETKNTPRRRRRSLAAFAPQIAGLTWKWVGHADRFQSQSRPPAAGIDRGLTTIVWVDAEQWVAHGDELSADHPIRTVLLVTWPRIVPSPPLPGFSLENRHIRLVPRTVIRMEELRRYRSARPFLGVMTARDRLLIPHLLAAEWPGIDFRLPN